MSERVTNNGNITIVDPNFKNTKTVDQEDLFIYVKLLARTKSRSILTQTESKNVSIEQTLRAGDTNFTYPDSSVNLNTDWTDIGGSKIDGGTDFGTFGITGIDIDINSSVQPKVTIDFVDIRGATLFEQGTCSPYASFFHMPYPVFELTVKGFYGKPVKYTLALRKFTSKFNPSTGNFEIRGEFIGYTYAFLADLVMGYALAAPYMPGGSGRLNDIWTKARTEQGNSNSLNKIPEIPVTLKQMIKDIGELENVLSDLANTNEFQNISRLKILVNESDKLREIINTYIQKVRELGIGVEFKKSEYPKGGKTLLKLNKTDVNWTTTLQKLRDLTGEYFNNGKVNKGDYVVLMNTINKSDYKPDSVKNITIDTSKKTSYGIFASNTKLKSEKIGDETNEYAYFDLGLACLKQLSTFQKQTNEILVKQQKELTNTINSVVERQLGYLPTVKNVMTIISCNMELFLKLLAEASGKAEETHEGTTPDGILGDGTSNNGRDYTKVYPWPTYYENENGTNVEVYPGKNLSLRYWEEVRFVEDFLKAYLELKEDLELISGEVQGKIGFDNYIPINPIESPLFDDDGLIPISYWRDKQKDEVLKNVGERAFIVGDYTLLNKLSTNNYEGTTELPKQTDEELMRSYGEIDGINAVNNIVETVTLISLENLINNENNFKNEVIKSLGITLDGDTYIYDNIITIGDGTNVINLSANPNLNDNVLLISEEGPDRKITVTGKLETKLNDTNGLFKGVFPKSLSSKYVQPLLDIGEDDNYFDIDDECKIPKVNQNLKENFIKLHDWTDDDVNLDIGSITQRKGLSETSVDFSKAWSYSNTGDALIQTPLWAKNLTVDTTYRLPWFNTYYETNQTGLHTDKKTSDKSLAYLTLISLGYGDDDDKGFANWGDAKEYTNTITPYLNITGSKLEIPKSFVLITGAVLWRMRESGLIDGLNSSNNNVDPIKWWTNGGRGVKTNLTLNTDGVDGTLNGEVFKITVEDSFLWIDEDFETAKNIEVSETSDLSKYKKIEPYHWPLVKSGEKHISKNFMLIEKDSEYDYADIREDMKTLLNLPNSIKIQFINEFENWSQSDWSDTYLKNIDPLSSGRETNIFNYYGLDVSLDYRLGIKNGKGDDEVNNEKIEDMYSDLYGNFYTITNTTPKSFTGIPSDDLNNFFNLTKDEMDAFLEGWILGFKSVIKEKLNEKQNGTSQDQLSSDNSTDDNDIKLNLYKSFKSLYDKWIATSKKNGADSYSLFYNQSLSGDINDRTLIDHFKFVNRAFNDIGDKAVIDITFLKNLATNPTQTLYQTVTSLLSKNNFDFFPLPNFVPFGINGVKDKENIKNLEKMFSPVTDLKELDSSPSFVCMYIGGTSKNLNLGTIANSNCVNGKEVNYNYSDDGATLVGLTDKTPGDLKEGVNVTAFKVTYGQENQDHFKSVSLDQAEFKETQESLMVIDQLAKGGNENNRVAKGQNLYNVYQTRSYTCEVEAMGNLMIQPLMYFELTNVPMFRGAYLITEVKHNVKPNYVSTVFKGTRVPRVVTPIVTDAYSTMVLGQTDLSKNTGSISDVVNNFDTNFSLVESPDGIIIKE